MNKNEDLYVAKNEMNIINMENLLISKKEIENNMISKSLLE
jgi:hypothetical protein